MAALAPLCITSSSHPTGQLSQSLRTCTLASTASRQPHSKCSVCRQSAQGIPVHCCAAVSSLQQEQQA